MNLNGTKLVVKSRKRIILFCPLGSEKIYRYFKAALFLIAFSNHCTIKPIKQMDIALIIAGIVLLIAGIAGSFLPVIPGPPLSYLALLLLHFTSFKAFSTDFLIIMAVVVVILTVLDYMVPAWGATKFGGTKYGAWGSTIGLIIGIVAMGPFGIVIGPFLGAYLGETIAGSDSKRAFKAALGSFLGFVAGTVMKLIYGIVAVVYFIMALV